jgi:hypothetical protein
MLVNFEYYKNSKLVTKTRRLDLSMLLHEIRDDFVYNFC